MRSTNGKEINVSKQGYPLICETTKERVPSRQTGALMETQRRLVLCSVVALFALVDTPCDQD